MSVYLLTYDLSHETKRPPIVKFIRDEFAYARLSESSYAVETNLTAAQLYDVFKHFLDADDRFYAVRLSNPHAGFGPVAVNNWLAEKLREPSPIAA